MKRLVICLMIGAALQSVVAVVRGLDGRYPERAMAWEASITNAGRLYMNLHPAVGKQARWIHVTSVPPEMPEVLDWSAANWQQVDWVAHFISDTRPKMPHWSRLREFSVSWNLNDLPLQRPWWGYEVGCGWPWLSATYFATGSKGALGAEIWTTDGILVDGTPRDASLPRVIPLRIIWPGALANTFLYALALFVPFTLIPMTRRHLRRRAGRCIACGYDLRGAAHSVCPECGAAHD